MAALSYAQLEGLWLQVGGPAELAPTMAAIALAESGGNPDALNPNDNHGTQSSFGLWQVSNGTHTPPAPNWADPVENAQLALGKYDTQGLGAWGTYTSGAYRAFLQSGTAPAAPPRTVQLAPPLKRQTRGVPPKATLSAERAYAAGGSTLSKKPNTLNTWNLLWGQVGYWLPDALNRSRQGRIAMRRLRTR